MESDNWQDGQPSSNNVSQSVPRNYNFLLRMSRRLGNVATQSSFIHDVRSFMNQEITYNSPSRWLDSGIAMLRGGRQEPATATSNAQQAEAKKERDLKKIVTQSHEILMSANTVFPISLFPDTVTVDRTKVTITKRDFFWSADVMSIRIEDVLNVSASVGPLFGSLTVASRVMSTIDHFQINHFWRSDAIRLKHIIQGYVIAQHNNIDTAHLKKEELIETLLELGVDTNK